MAYKLVRLSSLSAKPVDYTLFDSDVLYSTIGTPDWVASGYTNTIGLSSARLTLADIAQYLSTSTRGSWVSAGNNLYPNTNTQTVTAKRVEVNALYSTGNVGIGTDTPELTLDIYGGALETGIRLQRAGSPTQTSVWNYDKDGGFSSIGTTGTDEFYLYTNNITRLAIDQTGQVGIGTTSPTSNLHIWGDAGHQTVTITAPANYDATLTFEEGTTNRWSIGNDGDDTDKFKLSTGGDLTEPKLTVDSSGNVGIGLTNPAYKLVVMGTGYFSDALYCASDITAFYSSDIKLKENISNIPFPLEKIEQLNGVEFTWNSLAKDKTGEEYGVIAQDVEKVLPLAVTERDNGFKAVRYEKLIPLLIESIKELSEKVKQLEGNR